MEASLPRLIIENTRFDYIPRSECLNLTTTTETAGIAEYHLPESRPAPNAFIVLAEVVRLAILHHQDGQSRSSQTFSPSLAPPHWRVGGGTT